MPVRRGKPPSRSPSRRSPRRQWWRPLLAAAVLVGVVALVVLLAARPAIRHPPVARVTAAETIVALAGRAGCPAEGVEVEARDGGGTTVTVRAPASFDLERFVLSVEAAAHNSGGRVESLPLGEGGGYGRVRLEGTIAGERMRILVVGEQPRRRGRVAAAVPPAPRLAVILDDAGNSLEVLGGLDALPPEVAVAVLPNASHSAAVARALGASQRELLLHMPMEPTGDAVPGPGPGALEVGLDRGEVQRRLDAALAVVVGARGVNNHMGSRATTDRQLMGWVMEELARRRLYFIDSRTTADSVAFEVAHAAGVPAAERDVFLDVVAEPEAIRRALQRAASEARTTGRAVAIGHVHRVTVETLAVELPRLVAEGVRLVPPSRLVARAE